MSETPLSPSTRSSGRSAAGSRVASIYRNAIQNSVLGRARRNTEAHRNAEAQRVAELRIQIPEQHPAEPTGSLDIVSVLGWRQPRDQPLIHSDLWKNGQGPTEQTAQKDHHKCGICHFAKSHPVSYVCGHSHCYVCIRLWLERRWTCPVCIKPMYQAPFRHYGEEAALASDYPDWEDKSVVEYCWDGLKFPKEPEILVPETP